MGDMKTACWRAAQGESWHRDRHPWPGEVKVGIKTAGNCPGGQEQGRHGRHLQEIDIMIDLKTACLSAVRIELWYHDQHPRTKGAMVDLDSAHRHREPPGFGHGHGGPPAADTVIDLPIISLRGEPGGPKAHDGHPPAHPAGSGSKAQLPNRAPHKSDHDHGLSQRPDTKNTPKAAGPSPVHPAPEHRGHLRQPSRTKPAPKAAPPVPTHDAPGGPDRPRQSPETKTGSSTVEHTTDHFMKQYAKLSELSQWQTLRVSQVKLEMDLATGLAQLVKGMGSDVKGLTQ